MNDEELAERVAHHMRTSRPDDEETLRAVAEGRINEEQARARGVSEKLLELYRPLGSDFQSRTAGELSSLIAPVPAPSSGRPRARWARRTRRSIVVGGVAACAAALMFGIVSPSGSSLPNYESTFSGGERRFRGSEPDSSETIPTLNGDSQVDWLLRPRSEAGSTISARLYARNGERTLTELPAALEIASSGAVRVRGTVRSLGIPDDTHFLIVALTSKEEAVPLVVMERLEVSRWRSPDGQAVVRMKRLRVRSGSVDE